MSEYVERLLRRREVEEITGLARSSIYEKIKNDVFPRPVQIGKRAVAWKESDVKAWIRSKTYTEAKEQKTA
jgi:prophage regulatory protein